MVDAALKVRSFDAQTKTRLQAARVAYLRFEDDRSARSASFIEHLERVHAALDGKSVADMITALDHLLEQDLDEGATAGLEVAKAVLVDGATSIYSPDFSFTELLESATDTGVQEVAQVDAECAAAAGGGSGGGAVAGAGSIGAAIAVVYHAFFG